jgi:hypothetical protein
MTKLRTFAGLGIAVSLLAILALPTVAQADEQQYGSGPAMQAMPRVVGRSVLLDVPGLGEVSVPEERYREIDDLLKSDDPADQEQAFAVLQRSAEEESAPQSTPPRVFAIIHPPPASASSSAAPSSAPDLAEPLSFDHPAPKHRERGLW